MNHAPITLAPEARRWVVDHGGVITLRQSMRHGCCGGSALVPVAEIGEPNEPEKYVEQLIDGVRIFRPTTLTIDEATPIAIDLAGLWRWRRLVVTGIEIETAYEKAR